MPADDPSSAPQPQPSDRAAAGAERVAPSHDAAHTHAPDQRAGDVDQPPHAANAEAAALLGALAAAAVGRDVRVLHAPLAAAAPWSAALPPAAWRVFAGEMADAVLCAPEDQTAAMTGTLDRWAAIAARFA